MGYRNRLDNIIPERLAVWYLYKPKSFQLTLEQLAELTHELCHPVNLSSKDRYIEVHNLLKTLGQIYKAKTGKEFAG